MKKFLQLLFLLLTLQSTFGQQKKKAIPFFETNLMGTLAINENWTLDEDDDETFFRLSSAFLHVGLGYQFGKRLLISLNGGIDHYSLYDMYTVPAYIKLRFNLWTDVEQAWFVQFSGGTLWRPSDRFADGDYYSFGMGYEIESDSRWKPIISFMYHRKNLQGFPDITAIESLTVGIGFRFF